jgi:hypothetical protein
MKTRTVVTTPLGVIEGRWNDCLDGDQRQRLINAFKENILYVSITTDAGEVIIKKDILNNSIITIETKA